MKKKEKKEINEKEYNEKIKNDNILKIVNNNNIKINKNINKEENSKPKNINIKKIDVKINQKVQKNLINNNKKKNIPKSPDIKKRFFEKKFLIKNRNIEESFLSEKEKEENKSFDYGKISPDKRNRYRRLFDENEEKKRDNPFTFIFEFKYFEAASRLNNLLSTGELKSTVYFL